MGAEKSAYLVLDGMIANLEVMQRARHSCVARCSALGAADHVPRPGVAQICLYIHKACSGFYESPAPEKGLDRFRRKAIIYAFQNVGSPEMMSRDKKSESARE